MATSFPLAFGYIASVGFVEYGKVVSLGHIRDGSMNQFAYSATATRGRGRDDR